MKVRLIMFINENIILDYSLNEKDIQGLCFESFFFNLEKNFLFLKEKSRIFSQVF